MKFVSGNYVIKTEVWFPRVKPSKNDYYNALVDKEEGLTFITL